MAKFHVNPVTGNTSACNAVNKPCPYGGEEVHGATEAEARQAFERSQVTVPSTVSKGAQAQVDSYRKADASYWQALKEYHASASSLTKEEREEVWQQVQDLRVDAKSQLTALEKAGLGYCIPDDGPTLRVANMAQKILLEDNLLGQISDGMWENTQPYDHWEVWCNAKIIVDPRNVGRNFYARKDNYQLNSSELLSIVGDEMVDSVKVENPDYDEKKMRADLAALRKVFKASRKNHPGSKVIEAPTPAPAAAKPKAATPKVSKPKAAPAAPSNGSLRSAGGFTSSYAMNVGNHASDSMVSVAMAGPGGSKPKGQLYGRHNGMANPTTGDGATPGGNFIVAAKADGSRARVIRTPDNFMADPGAELGRPFDFLKEQKNGDYSETSDLHIMGYKDSAGNVFGYMPNKKIQYFDLR